jgi:hypothetical protein
MGSRPQRPRRDPQAWGCPEVTGWLAAAALASRRCRHSRQDCVPCCCGDNGMDGVRPGNSKQMHKQCSLCLSLLRCPRALKRSTAAGPLLSLSLSTFLSLSLSLSLSVYVSVSLFFLSLEVLEGLQAEHGGRHLREFAVGQVQVADTAQRRVLVRQ